MSADPKLDGIISYVREAAELSVAEMPEPSGENYRFTNLRGISKESRAQNVEDFAEIPLDLTNITEAAKFVSIRSGSAECIHEEPVALVLDCETFRCPVAIPGQWLAAHPC